MQQRSRLTYAMAHGSIIAAMAVLWAVSTPLGPARAAEAHGQPCPDVDARVVHAFRLRSGVSLQTREERDAAARGDKSPAVGLGDTIVLEVERLQSLSRHATCLGKPIVLAFNERLFSDLVAFPSLDPSKDLVRFDLKLDEGNRRDWVYHLGEPRLDGREVKVSVATSGEPALPTDGVLTLVPVRRRVLLAWAAGFLVMLAAFLALARRSNLLRADASELAGGSDGRPQYSLSRVQAAWWFFVVMAAYLLIGSVTGDFEGSLNGTALALLGIGAGTALGSAMIDSSRPTSGRAGTADARASLGAARRDLERGSLLSQADIDAPEKAALETSMRVADARVRRLLGISRGFLVDIVSDATGVVFHRFQVVAWTLVLTVVFVVDVYRNLAMPEFSDTLLGLQGLSAITFLGLKLPEAKVA